MIFFTQWQEVATASVESGVPLDVPDLVHLVAQQGSELDPKCDT